ncbi:flippase [Pectobacterium carotovorum]|uniref:flippase n=1 Tax=Pectobacterium carotovorum TaxID=554 RepID=UPI000E75BB59|nr:flippase [Pectobacterium carotovorum]RJL38794.1 flippase [Pectobacterium carotovorum]
MSLIKNSFYNILGYAIPTIIAIPSLGFLARTLGSERFGIYTLAIALIGYASIFDAGLTRAVVREIALYRDDYDEKKNIISTSASTVFFLGLFGSLMLFLNSSLIAHLLNISPQYQEEVIKSFKLLSIAVPIFLLNQIWLSTLEGDEKFLNINIQKWISSSVIAGLPALFVMIYSPTLFWAVLGLLCGRILSLIVTFILNHRVIVSAGIRFNYSSFLRMIKFGGWITVSNFISPMMSYFDRFIVSNISGASVVAFYTAPAEMISRLSVIPAALSRAIFPKLSFSTNELEKRKLIRLAYIMLIVSCVPIALFGMYFSNEILVLWLGGNFSGTPATILCILLVGFCFNCFAHIPYASIQAMGKSKITALIHMIEFLPYVAVLYFLVNTYGIVGAAVSWSLRVVLDFIFLFIINYFFTKNKKEA